MYHFLVLCVWTKPPRSICKVLKTTENVHPHVNVCTHLFGKWFLHVYIGLYYVLTPSLNVRWIFFWIILSQNVRVMFELVSIINVFFQYCAYFSLTSFNSHKTHFLLIWIFFLISFVPSSFLNMDICGNKFLSST